jgi:hypothetical protein
MSDSHVFAQDPNPRQCASGLRAHNLFINSLMILILTHQHGSMPAFRPKGR